MGRAAAFVLVPMAALVALSLVDCAQSSCTPTLRYSIPDGPVLPGVLNLSGHQKVDCWITFSHGSIVAEYHLAPFAPEFGPALPPDPHGCDNDGIVAEVAHETCEVIKGPKPDECFRTADCVVANFDGFAGALEQFLGSTTFDVSVMCGNDVIARSAGLSAKGEVCAI